MIEKCLVLYAANDEVMEYALTCLMKLVAKLSPQTIPSQKFVTIFTSLTKSVESEVQKRACEYLYLLQSDWNAQSEYIFQTGLQYANALT